MDLFVIKMSKKIYIKVVEARNLAAKGHGKNANASVPYCMVLLPPTTSSNVFLELFVFINL